VGLGGPSCAVEQRGGIPQPRRSLYVFEHRLGAKDRVRRRQRTRPDIPTYRNDRHPLRIADTDRNGNADNGSGDG